MKTDLDKLGEIKKEASGILKLHDFMELFKLVTKHAKKKISQIKQEFAKERREALKNGREADYRRIVSEQMKREEAIYQEIASDCMSHFGIEE